MPMPFMRKRTIDVIEALAGHKAGRLLLVDVREAGERARAAPAWTPTTSPAA